MKKYEVQDVLRLAKRQNNKKRKYLFVDPLQGKHMPVQPTRAVNMMKALGQKVAAKYPEARLVIGFAETATAIGAVVAAELAADCIYLQTTREEVPSVRHWIDFMEEHSHAPQQKLADDHLDCWIGQTSTILFVDDELSTGRTLCNIVRKLREDFPVMKEKKIVAVSILNRLSEKNLQVLQQNQMACEWLVKLPQEDYTRQVETIPARDAEILPEADAVLAYRKWPVACHYDSRVGVPIGKYVAYWQQKGKELSRDFARDIHGKVLVLGTEECMLPGLVIGLELAARQDSQVQFYATTRSPISISTEKGYPVQSGWRVKSLYEEKRENFLYNVQAYDMVFIVSDTRCAEAAPIQSLLRVLQRYGCHRFIYIGRPMDV